MEEGIREELADLAPSLGNVEGNGPLEVGRAEEAGPALVAGRWVAGGGIRERQAIQV